MNEFDEACLEYFLAHQEQLLPEPVAETMEEAEEFLEDCMAVVCKNLKEVKAYFEDQGADIEGMSLKRSICPPGWQISDRGSLNFYKFPGMGLTKEKMFIILKKFAKQAE